MTKIVTLRQAQINGADSSPSSWSNPIPTRPSSASAGHFSRLSCNPVASARWPPKSCAGIVECKRRRRPASGRVDPQAGGSHPVAQPAGTGAASAWAIMRARRATVRVHERRSHATAIGVATAG